MCSSGSCKSDCIGCTILRAIVALVLTLTTVAALLNVWAAHHSQSGAWFFGSLEGSASLVALVLSIGFWLKTVKKLCPCNKAACGASACGCGSKGMCPMCNHTPCTCGKGDMKHDHDHEGMKKMA